MTWKKAKNLELKLREDVTISWKDGLFTLSMGESGRGRKQRFAKVEELSDITIFSDTSAIEIFINNGETVLTTRVYSEHLEQKVELVSREVKGSVHGYELGSFEVEYKKIDSGLHKIITGEYTEKKNKNVDRFLKKEVPVHIFYVLPTDLAVHFTILSGSYTSVFLKNRNKITLR